MCNLHMYAGTGIICSQFFALMCDFSGIEIKTKALSISAKTKPFERQRPTITTDYASGNCQKISDLLIVSCRVQFLLEQVLTKIPEN